MTCVSGISTFSNSSVLSLREKSSVVTGERQAWGSKLSTPSTQFARIRNFGLESALSSSAAVSTCSASRTRGRHLAQRCAASIRQRHICSSTERSTGMALEERLSDESMDKFVEVVHKLADAARVITLKYFRSKFQIIDKADLSE